MKIALFDNLPDGGAKRVAFEQVKRLSKHYEVFYLTGKQESYFHFEKYAKKVFRFDLELPDHSEIMRPLKDIGYLTYLCPEHRRIAGQIRKLGVKLLIARPSMHTQAPILMTLSKPVLYYADEWLRLVYEPDNFLIKTQGVKRWYERRRRGMLKMIDWISVRSASKIIVNSEYTKNRFLKAYGKLPIDTIYPGVDVKSFYPGADQRQYFLFIGDKEAINGYDILESALSRSPIPFRVKYVEFVKHNFRYDDRRMNKYYQQAVATLCLSRNEPFGMTAIESMACGTPVIAVDEGGYRETVIDQETGLLIERNAEALYRAMKKMAVETEMRTSMSKRCRKGVLEKFTWKDHIDQLIEEIEGLV